MGFLKYLTSIVIKKNDKTAHCFLSTAIFFNQCNLDDQNINQLLEIWNLILFTDCEAVYYLQKKYKFWILQAIVVKMFCLILERCKHLCELYRKLRNEWKSHHKFLNFACSVDQLMREVARAMVISKEISDGVS